MGHGMHRMFRIPYGETPFSYIYTCMHIDAHAYSMWNLLVGGQALSPKASGVGVELGKPTDVLDGPAGGLSATSSLAVKL